MGWWITLGIFVLLAVLPLGVSVLYDADGAVVKVIAGPIKITLFPRPKKVKKPKKEKTKKSKEETSEPKPKKKKKKKSSDSAKKTEPAKKAKPARANAPVQQTQPVSNSQPSKQEKPVETEVKPTEAEEKPKKKGGSLLDFLPLVRIALDFLGDFKRKLRVNLLELKITLAGDDPCDLATNYGRAWAALGNLLPRLERFLKIQKRDLNVQCDFTASQTTIYAKLDLTITLGRLLAAVFVFAFRALVEFIKIMIKRKGGTENEPKSS